MNTFLKIRNNTFYITLIWLFVYSALVPMQLSNFVLCIGEDGHVEFEFSINGCCADIDTHDDDEHAESDDTHCGNCIDLPIFASINTELYIVPGIENPQLNDTYFSSTLISIQPIVYSYSPTPPNFDNPPLKDPTLLSLRTVVLLT